MSKIRESARDEECQIRIPAVCTGDPATTVLCHLPSHAMGAKCDDIHGSYGCHACHDYVDGRVQRPDDAHYALHRKIWFYEGVFRTQTILLEKGLITIE